MRRHLRLLLLTFLIVSLSAADSHSFTGEISDVMCGASKRAMGNREPNHAACAMKCVAKGEKYALVLKDGLVLALTPGKLSEDEIHNVIETGIRKGASQFRIRGTLYDEELRVDDIAPLNLHSKS